MTVDDTTEIFRRVLEIPDVTPDSDFFDLGGDSLLGTRVLSAVARATGVELSFDDFLLAATPGALAKRVAEFAAEIVAPA
ncbi:acyl carrier protein [Catenulispora sp. MAP5-51]|jgi:acyl carrier protein|uniref:acyl carrier protein n=1 Tax=Catenulispora sp. MAP5-51 TaxID=3156298 RepID=UPI0035134E49